MAAQGLSDLPKSGQPTINPMSTLECCFGRSPRQPSSAKALADSAYLAKFTFSFLRRRPLPLRMDSRRHSCLSNDVGDVASEADLADQLEAVTGPKLCD